MKFYITTILFLLTLFTQAQTNLGGWYMYFANASIKDSPFKIHLETQLRNHEIHQDLDQLLFRTGLQYNLKNLITFTAGYGFIHTEKSGTPDLPIIENRIYQEVLLPQNINSVKIRHRFRYEQRFIEDIDFKTRYRYSLNIEIPIKQLKNEKQIFASAYNEIFINGLKIEETDPIFDRNRIYLGGGLKLNQNLTVQMGWMNQILNNDSQSKVMLSINHNLTI